MIWRLVNASTKGSSYSLITHASDLHCIASSTLSVHSNIYSDQQYTVCMTSTTLSVHSHICSAQQYHINHGCTFKYCHRRKAVAQSPSLVLHMYLICQEHNSYSVSKNMNHVYIAEKAREKSRQYPKVFPGSPPP